VNPEIKKTSYSYPDIYSAKKVWRSYLAEPAFLIELGITIVFLAALMIFFSFFLNKIESRIGVQLNDPLLKLYMPVDLSNYIFIIIYSSITAGLLSLWKNPAQLLFAFQAYILMIMIRMLTLYIVPLNAPENTIPLIDPVVKYFGTGQTLTKDLFFSGHTATIFLLFLAVLNKRLKVLFLIFFFILGAAVLAQHVHYTIDVVSAPFFAYTSYRIALLLGRRFKLNHNYMYNNEYRK
jgi:hypothetical protein